MRWRTGGSTKYSFRPKDSRSASLADLMAEATTAERSAERQVACHADQSLANITCLVAAGNGQAVVTVQSLQSIEPKVHIA